MNIPYSIPYSIPNPEKDDKDQEQDQEKEKEQETPLVQDFETFWKAYPKKVGKGAALKVWKRIKPRKELQEKMINAVNAWKTTEQWTKDNGQFIPHPATWLNRHGWDDEPLMQTGPVISELTRHNAAVVKSYLERHRDED